MSDFLTFQYNYYRYGKQKCFEFKDTVNIHFLEQNVKENIFDSLM